MLRGLRERKYWLYLSSISYLLSITTYHSPRLLIPLLLLSFALIFKSQIIKQKKQVTKVFIVSLILFSPLIPLQFSSQGTDRALGTSYFSSQPIYKTTTQFIRQYSQHFDTTFLFFHGDLNGRHSVRKLGMMYYFDLPLVLLGLWSITKLQKSPKNFILAWLFLSPIPAALTKPTPHALRSLNMLPPLILLSALGSIHLIRLTKKLPRYKSLKYPIALFFTLIVIYNLSVYLEEYYLRYPQITALDWADGNKQAVQAIKDNYSQYDTIYLTQKLPLIYLATYLSIPPKEYQQIENKLTTKSFSYQKIIYFNKAWNIQNISPNSLIIAPSTQKPKKTTPYKTINISNGDASYNIWEADADK